MTAYYSQEMDSALQVGKENAEVAISLVGYDEELKVFNLLFFYVVYFYRLMWSIS